MTVLEHTRDRGSMLRRAGFVSAAFALSGAFGVALSGIASTRGSIDPGGQAAALVAAQHRASDATDTGPRHHCRHGARNRGRTGTGRV